MELNVTRMVEERDEMFLLSGSAMELGERAAWLTWRNSMEYARRNPLLSPDQIEEARDYFRSFGAWDDIDAWTVEEVQALTTQEVASQIREMERFDSYEEYVAAAEAGRIRGSLYYDNGNWCVGLSQ